MSRALRLLGLLGLLGARLGGIDAVAAQWSNVRTGQSSEWARPGCSNAPAAVVRGASWPR
jgi:hypothetical protein